VFLGYNQTGLCVRVYKHNQTIGHSISQSVS